MNEALANWLEKKKIKEAENAKILIICKTCFLPGVPNVGCLTFAKYVVVVQFFTHNHTTPGISRNTAILHNTPRFSAPSVLSVFYLCPKFRPNMA